MFSSQRTHIALILLLIGFIFTFDIANIDGVRQGTEGFYLLISEEMFSEGYFLTPRIVGENHWSKPPLQFWLPMPIKLLLPFFSYIGAARIAVLILSFWGTWWISKFISKYYKVQKLALFLGLISTISFFKYSRIFMMEAPLMILCCTSALLAYRYIHNPSNRNLFWGSLVIGISILIKGPVSFAMLTGGLGLYFLYELFLSKKNYFKVIFKLLSITFLIGSLWFIQAYMRFGDEFYNYFILRENLGKFNATNYPAIVVIQGLLIFSFPLIFFIIPLIQNLKSLFKRDDDKLFIFLFFQFLVHFFLWFIPKQKSHHYAIPSIYFFNLLILIPLLKTTFVDLKKSKIFLNVTLVIFCFLIIILTTVTLFFPSFFHFKSYIHLILTYLFMGSGLFLIFKSKNYIHYFLGLILTISSIWIFLIPVYILPIVPSSANVFIDHKPIAVIFRKPFFIQESIGKKVTIIEKKRLKKDLITHKEKLFIMPHAFYLEQNFHSKFTILHSWPIWKRGVKFNKIQEAIKNRDLKQIQDIMILAKQNL